MAPVATNIKSDASDCEAFSGMIHRPLMTHDNSRGAADAVSAPGPPAVVAPFHWTRESWGAALRAAPIEVHAKHLFTTSQLRLPAHASPEEREPAWEALTQSLGVPRQRLLRVRQVHGREVRVVRRDDPASAGSGQLPDGDAIVSNVPVPCWPWSLPTACRYCSSIRGQEPRPRFTPAGAARVPA